MKNDCSAQNVLNGKTVCEKNGKSAAVAGEQRRHIPSVIRMGTVIRIVVSPDIGKRVLAVPCAGVSAVDVKGEDRALTRSGGYGKTLYRRSHQNTVFYGVEPYFTPDGWVFLGTFDRRSGTGTPLEDREIICEAGIRREIIHNHTVLLILTVLFYDGLHP